MSNKGLEVRSEQKGWNEETTAITIIKILCSEGHKGDKQWPAMMAFDGRGGRRVGGTASDAVYTVDTVNGCDASDEWITIGYIYVVHMNRFNISLKKSELQKRRPFSVTAFSVSTMAPKFIAK